MHVHTSRSTPFEGPPLGACERCSLSKEVVSDRCEWGEGGGMGHICTYTSVIDKAGLAGRESFMKLVSQNGYYYTCM